MFKIKSFNIYDLSAEMKNCNDAPDIKIDVFIQDARIIRWGRAKDA
jgi:hypothetical protein